MSGFDLDPEPILDLIAGRMGADGRGGLDLFAILEADRRDLDEIGRRRHLDQLGMTGHVAFGFYVEGFGEDEVGSLCNAAAIPSGVVFLDADASAAPGAELGRAPRSVTFEVREQETIVVSPGFETPWRMKSMSTPGALNVKALVIATWSEGSATFLFATVEGARESVDALEGLLAKSPQP
jgi:hypothetical protein